MNIIVIEEYLNSIQNELKSLKDVCDGKAAISGFIAVDAVAHISISLNGVSCTDKVFSDAQNILEKHGFNFNVNYIQHDSYYTYYRNVSGIVDDIRVKGLKELMKR